MRGIDRHMKLTNTQTQIIEWLRDHPRYELRRSVAGHCYMYDLEDFCHFDWVIWRKTVESLLRKGVIESFGQDSVTGAVRFRLCETGA